MSAYMGRVAGTAVCPGLLEFDVREESVHGAGTVAAAAASGWYGAPQPVSVHLATRINATVDSAPAVVSMAMTRPLAAPDTKPVSLLMQPPAAQDAQQRYVMFMPRLVPVVPSLAAGGILFNIHPTATDLLRAEADLRDVLASTGGRVRRVEYPNTSAARRRVWWAWWPAPPVVVDAALDAVPDALPLSSAVPCVPYEQPDGTSTTAAWFAECATESALRQQVALALDRSPAPLMWLAFPAVPHTQLLQCLYQDVAAALTTQTTVLTPAGELRSCMASVTAHPSGCAAAVAWQHLLLGSATRGVSEKKSRETGSSSGSSGGGVGGSGAASLIARAAAWEEHAISVCGRPGPLVRNPLLLPDGVLSVHAQGVEYPHLLTALAGGVSVRVPADCTCLATVVGGGQTHAFSAPPGLYTLPDLCARWEAVDACGASVQWNAAEGRVVWSLRKHQTLVFASEATAAALGFWAVTYAGENVVASDVPRVAANQPLCAVQATACPHSGLQVQPASRHNAPEEVSIVRAASDFAQGLVVYTSPARARGPRVVCLRLVVLCRAQDPAHNTYVPQVHVTVATPVAPGTFQVRLPFRRGDLCDVCATAQETVVFHPTLYGAPDDACTLLHATHWPAAYPCSVSPRGLLRMLRVSRAGVSARIPVVLSTNGSSDTVFTTITVDENGGVACCKEPLSLVLHSVRSETRRLYVALMLEPATPYEQGLAARIWLDGTLEARYGTR